MVDAAYPPIVQSALSKMDEQQSSRSNPNTPDAGRKPARWRWRPSSSSIFFLRARRHGDFFLLCCATVIGFVWWPVELCMIGKRVRVHNGELAVNLARDLS